MLPCPFPSALLAPPFSIHTPVIFAFFTVSYTVDNGRKNISGDEAHMRFDAEDFSAMDPATVHHVQLLVHKRSFSSDAIAGVVLSGCAKNGVTLQVQVVDSKTPSASRIPSWNQTLSASNLTTESWIRFELGGLKWLLFSGKPLRLKITANCSAHTSQILSPESRKEYEPYLVLYSKSPLSRTHAGALQSALQGGRQVARQRTTRRGASAGFATSSACGLRRYEVYEQCILHVHT